MWLVALGSLVWAIGAAVFWHQHPLLSGWAGWGALVFGGLACWRPSWSLGVLLCVLPVANLSMWTGWRLLEEMDLLVLLAASGMWVRLAWVLWGQQAKGGRTGPMCEPSIPRIVWVWGPWMLTSLLALARAHADLADHSIDMRWGDDTTWANSLRLIRPMAWLACLAPGIWLARNIELRWSQMLAWGMAGGVVVVSGLLLWERAAYTGVLNLGSDYRTTAFFWSMRVGGGALDAYLVMSMPFAWWLLLRARTWLQWGSAAVLLMAAVYGVVTTFSRGLLVASAMGSVWMWWWGWVAGTHVSRAPWGKHAHCVLAGALTLEAVLLVFLGHFAVERLHASGRDAVGRWAHWQASLSLAQEPATRWLGLGLGRLPAHYSSQVPGGGFPGQAIMKDSFLQLHGPATPVNPGDNLALIQRVDWSWQEARQVRLRIRAREPVLVRVASCERHLLYAVQCRWGTMLVSPRASIQGIDISLNNQTEPVDQAAELPWMRSSSLELSVLTVRGMVEVHGLEAWGEANELPLKNRGFTNGLAHWLAVADGHFLPWHADSLYLELRVERGIVGLVAFLWLCLGCFLHLRKAGRDPLVSQTLQVGIASMLLLGLLISVMEFTTVAFLLQFMLLWASFSGDEPHTTSS